jgi:RNA-splicing ligase RtcB
MRKENTLKTIDGKYASANVFTDNIEDKASEQILTLCNQSFVDGCKIRIMPDVHAGSGCVIGFTANLGKKVIPNIVGVDIGCGMLVAELGIEHIDPKKLDKVIRERVPAGMNVHESQKMSDSFLSQLDCKDSLHNVDWILRSMGTLGGGNHFIELDEDEKGNQYLVIHTGSRNLGKQVAEYHQSVAISNLKGKNKRKEATERMIAELKEQGREQEISQKIKELDIRFPDIPNELCYLEGEERDSYLNDMRICQAFARMNRARIMHTILDGVGIDSMLTHASFFETVHNYIDESDDIIRKGSVSAREGEKLIIPLNMRDGSLICVGKGNPDWNFSAPHGAGRLYSRTAAKKAFSVEEYQKQMNGIYTTSADESTLDECPMAYKPAQEIINAISPTVDIVKHIKPIYNFKAGE